MNLRISATYLAVEQTGQVAGQNFASVDGMGSELDATWHGNSSDARGEGGRLPSLEPT